MEPEPTGPDPGVSERPSRPDPVVMTGGAWPTRNTFLVGLVMAVVLFVIAFIFFASGSRTDVRENRQFGHLECVYNVTRDRVESCAAIYGG